MGSSSSRQRPPRHQQDQGQQQQAYAPPQQHAGPPPPPPGQQHTTHGRLYGGYVLPQNTYYGQQPPAAPDGAFGQPPRPQVETQTYHQTATVKNQVNLKKSSLKVEPIAGRPHDFSLAFTFDATAPCRVTSFLLATESPADGCRLVSAVLGAPPRTPAYYDKGMGLKFPPEEGVGEAHVISSLRAPMGHMMLASGDSYPLVIRLESLTEEGRAQGHTLEELEVGGPFPVWCQAQTTYAKLRQDEHGAWQVAVLKQKIFVKGVSYELQEIYGMEGAKPGGAAAAQGQGGGAPYDELEGRECVICMSAARDTMVLPCRHMCMCQECASALKTQTSRCPICRDEITSPLPCPLSPPLSPIALGRSTSSSPPSGLAPKLSPSPPLAPFPIP